jgi:hypothetical protein
MASGPAAVRCRRKPAARGGRGCPAHPAMSSKKHRRSTTFWWNRVSEMVLARPLVPRGGARPSQAGLDKRSGRSGPDGAPEGGAWPGSRRPPAAPWSGLVPVLVLQVHQSASWSSIATKGSNRTPATVARGRTPAAAVAEQKQCTAAASPSGSDSPPPGRYHRPLLKRGLGGDVPRRSMAWNWARPDRRTAAEARGRRGCAERPARHRVGDGQADEHQEDRNQARHRLPAPSYAEPWTERRARPSPSRPDQVSASAAHSSQLSKDRAPSQLRPPAQRGAGRA